MVVRRPSAQTVEWLRRRVDDPAFREAFASRVVLTAGSSCWWWTGAISGRGHGRLFLGRDEDGRSHVVIAHRFAYALEHGVDELLATPVLGHRCDNPLCQRIGPGHVSPSSPGGNRREYIARRTLAGTPLDAPGGARQRAVRARAQLLALERLDEPSSTQPMLWDPTPWRAP